MIKHVMGAVVALTLMTGAAWADEDRCLPGARLSEEVARMREAGKDEGAILKELEREGRIGTQGDGGIFEASIVVWVFQHEVASRDAYDRFQAECRKATRTN